MDEITNTTIYVVAVIALIPVVAILAWVGRTVVRRKVTFLIQRLRDFLKIISFRTSIPFICFMICYSIENILFGWIFKTCKIW